MRDTKGQAVVAPLLRWAQGRDAPGEEHKSYLNCLIASEMKSSHILINSSTYTTADFARHSLSAKKNTCEVLEVVFGGEVSRVGVDVGSCRSTEAAFFAQHLPSAQREAALVGGRCSCEAVHISILTSGLLIGSPLRRRHMPAAFEKSQEIWRFDPRL